MRPRSVRREQTVEQKPQFDGQGEPHRLLLEQRARQILRRTQSELVAPRLDQEDTRQWSACRIAAFPERFLSQPRAQIHQRAQVDEHKRPGHGSVGASAY